MAEGDAFSRDDIAFALVGSHRASKVVLVTQGNPRLEDAIRSLPGVRLEVIAPNAWKTDVRADVFVFDRFAPRERPSGAALLFQPDAVDWLPGARRAVSDPVISAWSRNSVLLEGISWDGVRMERAQEMTELPTDVSALVSTARGALIAAGHAGERWIVAGFAAEESNLSLQPGLPVFLGNAIRWLGEGDKVLSTSLGTVRVPVTEARVVDGAGRAVPVRAFANETLFAANRPDVYTVLAADERMRVVANVNDPRAADINVSRFDSTDGVRMGPAGSARIEPWFALVVFALFVMLIEWAAWVRRVSR